MFLFFLIVFLITYGSLYPFEFAKPDYNALHVLFQTWGSYTHQGDILANVVLFVPFGVSGVLMFSPKYKNKLAIIAILFFGLVLGIVLQIGQIYMPSRDANLSDAVLNFIGTIVGVILAVTFKTDKLQMNGVKAKLSSFPMLLVFSWLAYRLMPLVPSIDLQEIKNSIKPLFLYPEWESVRVFHDLTAWLITFFILARTKQKYFSSGYFALAILLCFFLEIIIVSNAVSVSNVAGAFLAVALWGGVFSRIKHAPALLAVMMVAVLIVSGFAPYEIAGSPQVFRFIPFYGFLGGSMMVNTSSLLEKFFLYGSLIWLLQLSGVRLWVATFITASVTLFIEVGQIFMVDHLAEITDPLLVIVIGFFVSSVTKENQAPGHVVAQEIEVARRAVKQFGLFTVKVFLYSPFLSQQIKGRVIGTENFPVQVGRSETPGISKTDHGYHIALGDIEPFQLSRLHFCIEQNESEVLVRDLNSTNGTLLNGKQLGMKLGAPQSGKLKVGENEVVAGRGDSNFYFRIILESA